MAGTLRAPPGGHHWRQLRHRQGDGSRVPEARGAERAPAAHAGAGCRIAQGRVPCSTGGQQAWRPARHSTALLAQPSAKTARKVLGPTLQVRRSRAGHQPQRGGCPGRSPAAAPGSGARCGRSRWATIRHLESEPHHAAAGPAFFLPAVAALLLRARQVRRAPRMQEPGRRVGRCRRVCCIVLLAAPPAGNPHGAAPCRRGL